MTAEQLAMRWIAAQPALPPTAASRRDRRFVDWPALIDARTTSRGCRSMSTTSHGCRSQIRQRYTASGASTGPTSSSSTICS
jgi:hypothetical protein